MRVHALCFAAPLISLVALGACMQQGTSSGTTGSGGKGSGGGSTSTSTSGGPGGSGSSSSSGTMSTSSGMSTSSSGAGGSMAGPPGWTPVALLDDNTDPNNMVFRSGNDLVTGIYFASLDDGWVTTQGSQQTFQNGGAIFKAKQKQVSSLLFSGNRNGLCLLGTIGFQGLSKTKDGFIALGYACDVIASHDGGKTFDIQHAAAGDQHGIEQVLAVRTRASDTVMIADTGYVSVTQGVPGPNAVWMDTWAPQANPPTPNPVPADQCQGGPQSGLPKEATNVYVSQDGNTMAYTSSPNFDPQICVSTDGGKSFFPKLLPNVPMEAQDFAPSGVVFADAKTAITFWANNIYPGKQYIYRSTDAGQTWSSVAVPADVAMKAIEMRSAFFAPDGQHGWIVGYDYDASIALLLRTTDGGATWKTVSSDLAAKVSMMGGGKLHTGFALDASHIWVGGDYGVLMANEAGGD